MSELIGLSRFRMPLASLLRINPVCFDSAFRRRSQLRNGEAIRLCRSDKTILIVRTAT